MEAQEWGGSASPRGDHGIGTQGSPVWHQSRLADVERELRLRATDYLMELDFKLGPRQAPTDKLASE